MILGSLIFALGSLIFVVSWSQASLLSFFSDSLSLFSSLSLPVAFAPRVICVPSLRPTFALFGHFVILTSLQLKMARHGPPVLEQRPQCVCCCCGLCSKGKRQFLISWGEDDGLSFHVHFGVDLIRKKGLALSRTERLILWDNQSRFYSENVKRGGETLNLKEEKARSRERRGRRPKRRRKKEMTQKRRTGILFLVHYCWYLGLFFTDSRGVEK
jgi:hypothetical protein